MIKETLIASRYEIQTQDTSRIDPTQTVTRIVGIGCPHCHVVLLGMWPEHGQTIECSKCGLKMTRFGNALDCEMEDD